MGKRYRSFIQFIVLIIVCTYNCFGATFRDSEELPDGSKRESCLRHSSPLSIDHLLLGNDLEIYLELFKDLLRETIEDFHY